MCQINETECYTKKTFLTFWYSSTCDVRRIFRNEIVEVSSFACSFFCSSNSPKSKAVEKTSNIQWTGVKKNDLQWKCISFVQKISRIHRIQSSLSAFVIYLWFPYFGLNFWPLDCHTLKKSSNFHCRFVVSGFEFLVWT